MERLWAPWRHIYVTGASGESNPCIFCSHDPNNHDPDGTVQREPPDNLQPDPQREALMLARGRVSFVILNLYPYNSGHLMVVPHRHVANLASTTSEEQLEMMRFARHAEMALTEAYAPQGINIGINLGRSAGAGVLDHLHIHMVPRWNGDTNFMTAIGDTRVLPESLEVSALRLRPIFERLAQDNV
jgi:ATP adenylyltransferase